MHQAHPHREPSLETPASILKQLVSSAFRESSQAGRPSQQKPPEEAAANTGKGMQATLQASPILK